MDKNEALTDVQEIKRIMEASLGRSTWRETLIGGGVVMLALALQVLCMVRVPAAAPLVGMVLLVGGGIGWRRCSDPATKAMAGGIATAGIVFLLLALLLGVAVVA